MEYQIGELWLRKRGLSMDKENLKKNMLLKRKNGGVQIKEHGDRSEERRVGKECT